MTSKFCKQLLITLSMTGAAVYSMDAGGAAGMHQAAPAVGQQVSFPGPITAPPMAGNQWQLDQLLQQVNSPGWNGVLIVPGGISLNQQLTAEQLRLLEGSIQKLLGSHTVTFGPAVPVRNDPTKQEIRATRFDATLLVSPPIDPRNVEAVCKAHYGDLFAAGKRSITLEAYGLPGKTLGTTWKALGDFIKHFSSGFQEAALLMELKGIARTHTADTLPATKENIAKGLDALHNASEAWNALNTEFEKPQLSRNSETIAKESSRLNSVLQFLHGFLGFGAYSSQPPVASIMSFVSEQPADKVFEAYLNCRGGFGSSNVANVAAAPRTTTETLDHLLTEKPNAEFAAIKGAAPGLVKTMRLDNRLWNVYKIDDSQATKWQEDARGRQPNGWFNWRGDQQFNQQFVQPCEARFAAIAKELNLKDGSYTIAFRAPAGGIHQFIILSFKVWHDQWDPQTNAMTAVRASLAGYVGKIEMRDAASDGGRTMAMYDPFRAHGKDSIRGTIMEQRVHAAMVAHRVHQFGQLPADVQAGLRSEIEGYNHNRYQTRLADQGLGGSALTPHEIKLPDGSDARTHETAAKSRAAKLSAELEARFAAVRASRMRTHGDDLTVDPAQHLNLRVHSLFSPENTHAMKSDLPAMSPRERQFYGSNKPGGYLDTVETAIAAKAARAKEAIASGARLDVGSSSAVQADRAHYDASKTHADRLRKGNYDVAIGFGQKAESSSSSASLSPSPAVPHAAPITVYDKVADALADADYDVVTPNKD